MDVLDEDRQAKWHAQAAAAGMLRPPMAADDCGTQHGRATLGHATRRSRFDGLAPRVRGQVRDGCHGWQSPCGPLPDTWVTLGYKLMLASLSPGG
ncbi:MAG: hypothetical protein V2A79_06555 [Planctomycetota bacterium]